jgi:NADPH:quinone reductase-like Zn-dependent oxidoreductase
VRAIVCTRYGPPEGLELQEVEKPTPRDNEVLIKVCAATVTRGDVMIRSLPLVVWLPMRIMIGLPRKRIPGHELAGQIEAIGRHVELFRQGDPVFGTTSGLSVGSYAEYVCLPEKRDGGALAMKPANMTYEEAAAVPVGGLTALHFLRRGNLQSGQRALIYGASGSVGTFAVQLAKHFGAEVVGVCSTASLELVRSLGVHHVIDYTREDFADGGARYDLIFDTVGKTSLSHSRKALTPQGSYVTVQRGLAREHTEDLVFLQELIEAGRIRTVIDRRYPLEQTAEAHRYVERGHKKGNVVINVVGSAGRRPGASPGSSERTRATESSS